VFENPDINLICETVEDELKFTLKNLNLPKEEIEKRVKEVAKNLKLESLLPRLTTHLSGGEKQLVAFASAIIIKPKILIFDESFTMLDGVSKEKIMKYLKKYYKENKCTVLQVTNDLEDYLYATDILILQQGEVSIFGKKEEVLQNEKVFKDAGLHLPFMADLSLKLKYYGLVDEPILDMDKMVKHLWK
jgi:energy-coupling factor transport system ATP-binding protein